LGREFYEDNGIPLHVVPSIEIAEMTKVAENAYRFVQISFAEELKMICNELNLSFEQVREACNTKWNIDLLDAKEGIGGHCLPKDIRYLISLTEGGTLLKSAITVDSTYKNWKATKAIS
jgi:UDP-N-acetyl-D-mannosaminuronate dehydrogenase